MFGRKSELTPLESRKQLLIAESELNRAQLIKEWHAMTDEVRTFGAKVKSVSIFASTAALLVAGLTAFRRGKSADANAKPSWLHTLSKGAKLAGSLWLAFRARPR